jgi:hypothetical protein
MQHPHIKTKTPAGLGIDRQLSKDGSEVNIHIEEQKQKCDKLVKADRHNWFTHLPTKKVMTLLFY